MTHSGSGDRAVVVNAAKAAWALYAIVFISGAVLMGLEIAGAKILAPGFGTSTFVWGAIIGMFMGALAAGYYVGGYLADKKPSFQTLALVVGAAAIWVFLLPRFGPGLSESIARADMGKVIDPLLASLLLFFIPSFLMGMVSPFSVKLNASSLAGVGGVAGRLYALSTFGSIVGTWLTTFVLIPSMKLSNVLQLLGVLLLLTATGCLYLFIAATGKISRAQVNTVGAMLLVSVMGTEIWAAVPSKPNLWPGTRLIHYEDSPYHEIQVTEEVINSDVDDKDGGYLIPCKIWDLPMFYQRRWLKFNENIESGTFPYGTKHKNAVTYTDLLHLPLIWVPTPKRILVVGGGGGIIPSQYYNWYGAQVDVAELDEKVANIAQEYFDMPRQENGKLVEGIKFHIGDGRKTIRRDLAGPYDIIFLDAYSSGGQIPFHLMTWDFMAEVKSKLAPNGILVTNIISGLQNGTQPDTAHNADLFLAEYKTLHASRAQALEIDSADLADKAPLFEHLYVFPKFYDDDELLTDGKLEEYRNVIVIATNEAKRRPVEGAPDSLEELAAQLSPMLDGLKEEKDREAAVEKAKVKCDLKAHVKSYKRLLAHKVPSSDVLEQFKVILTDNYAPVDLMYRPVKRDENSHRIR